jgi:hypothetical protein
MNEETPPPEPTIGNCRLRDILADPERLRQLDLTILDN